MFKIFTRIAFFPIFVSTLCWAQLDSVAILDQQLSPFWAQEYVGGDLVRQEMLHGNYPLVDVAVFDLGFEKQYINVAPDLHVPMQMNGRRKMTAHHGTAVMNILNGDSPIGLTDQANFIKLGAIMAPSMYSYHFRSFAKEGRYPKVISNSVGWSSYDEVAKLSKLAEEKGTLWFLAAGNDYPNPIDPVEEHSSAILVGSFSPSGLQSINTQISQRIAVLAPANHELASIDGKGNHFLFGETSGATPIVAATMINIVSVLPHITREQTLKLLQKTSFKSFMNQQGETKAPGLLNSYLAFHVAKRIQRACLHQSPFEANCIDQQLSLAANYIFHEQVIECDSLSGETAMKKRLIEMRKVALLTRDKEALEEVACAYKALGFTKNAEYFHFLSRGPNLEHMESQAIKALRQGLFEISYYKYLAFYDHHKIKEEIASSPLSSHRKKFLLGLLKKKSPSMLGP